MRPFMASLAAVAVAVGTPVVTVVAAGNAKPSITPTQSTFLYLGGRPSHDPRLGSYLKNANPDQTSWSVATSARGKASLWVSDFGGAWQLTVDGKAVTPIHHSSTARPPYKLTVSLTGSRAHVLVLRMAGDVYFGGGRGTLSKPKIKTGPRTVFLADSYGEGQGADAAFTSVTMRAADRLGLRDAYNAGSGGTGYTTGGPVLHRQPFGDRADRDVFAVHPALVVIAGGLNDQSASPSTVTAAASALYAHLHARLPGAKLIVVGPWSPGQESAALLATRDAIKEAATNAGLPFIDPIASGWITAANAARYIGADHIHPNQSGHDYLGGLLAASLKPYVH